MTTATVEWIVKDCRPLSITSDEGFVNLMKLATSCKTYKPPCYSTLTEKIHYMFTSKQQDIKARLQKATAVSLTADFWTSCQNRSYIGVTVHFIENWQLNSLVLNVIEVSESHTANVCGKLLCDIAAEWEIEDKVLCIVTDRGRNIVKGVEEHTPFLSTNCIAHIMQRGIAAGLKAASMDNVLAKCRKVVGHFKHSPLQSSLLTEMAEQLQISNLCLIQDVTTRWFSGLAMAQRLLAQKEAVNAVLDNNNKGELKLTDADFSRLEQLVKLLTPLKEVSDFLGGDKYATGSCAVRAVYKLELFLTPSEEEPIYIGSFKRAFNSYMTDNIRIPPVLTVCAALDPRFKKLSFLSQVDRDQAYTCILNGMIAHFGSTMAAISTHHDDGQVETTVNANVHSFLESDEENNADTADDNIGKRLEAELAAYRASPQEPIGCDPIFYWSKAQQSYPNVAFQASKLLSIPATSVPCERLFSVAGLLVDKRRTSLTPEHVQQMLCLSSWL